MVESINRVEPIDHTHAASILDWWLEAGVDSAISESPRNWLKQHSAAPPPLSAPPEGAAASPTAETLEAFQSWLRDSAGLPLDRPGSRRVLPAGPEAAPIMLLSDLPGAEEVAHGRAIAGEAWILAGRMLAAIGFEPDQAYLASLACFHAPGARLSRDDLTRCGEIAREHVRLARPERLLLLGDAPARALTGQPLADARGKVHRIEGVRAVATFHPRWLLQRPSDKALAWRDLLILMSDEG